MRVLSTPLAGVLVLAYDREQDTRGGKQPRYSARAMAEAGVDFVCAEEIAYTPRKAGTLYGIHFQNNPFPQAKMLYCERGRGLDYAVDLRRDSPAYLRWTAVELTGECMRQIFIPHGFGHAFLSLEDDTCVVMRVDRPFCALSRQIAWNDPDIGIQYPVDAPILAAHDVRAPLLRMSDINL